jgi:hypothetical protein
MPILNSFQACSAALPQHAQAGDVTGTSRAGVKLVASLERRPAGGVTVHTKAAYPFGQMTRATGILEEEADKFVAAYKKYAQ